MTSSLGTQCVCVKHTKKMGNRPDLTLIKTREFFDDGTSKDDVRLLKNVKKPFYVTSKQFRNHVQKKEHEHENRLIRYESTVSDMEYSVSQALGVTYRKMQLREAAKSPYLYGVDQTMPAYIKSSYQTKYPDVFDKLLKVTMFDTEVGVIPSLMDKFLIMTMANDTHAYCGVTREFLGGKDKIAENVFFDLLHKHLDQEHNLKDIDVQFKIFDTEAELIIHSLNMTHEWNTDILAIWNQNYDIPRIINRCEVLNINLGKLLAHPDVRKAYNTYKLWYKEGPANRVKSDGTKISLGFHQRWHILYSDSLYDVVDGMCGYYVTRTGEKKESSYSLDAILAKHGIGGKLTNIVDTDLKKIAWHKFMQSKHHIEYCVYALQDALSMVKLNNKTMDLTLSLPATLGSTEIARAPVSTALSYNSYSDSVKDDKLIPATKYNYSDEEIEKMDPKDRKALALDEEVLNMDDWIVTVPAYLLHDNGVKCLADEPELVTNIRILVSDVDFVSSYPRTVEALNVSKKTCVREVIRISGKSELTFRAANMGLTAGPVGSIPYCVEMLNYPGLTELLDIYEQKAA